MFFDCSLVQQESDETVMLSPAKYDSWLVSLERPFQYQRNQRKKSAVKVPPEASERIFQPTYFTLPQTRQENIHLPTERILEFLIYA